MNSQQFNKILQAITGYKKEAERCKELIRRAEMSIVDSFKAERKKRGLSLREVAKAFDVSPAYLSDVELGKRALTKKLLYSIEKF